MGAIGGQKIIVVARNPKDTVISWFKQQQMLAEDFFEKPADSVTLEDEIRKFFKGEISDPDIEPGDFWAFHIAWWQVKAGGDGVLWLNYEDMVKDLEAQVRKIDAFLGLRRSDEVIATAAAKSTFDAMKTSGLEGAPPMNAGRGGWRSKITGALNEEFDKVHAEKMAGQSFEFDF